MELKIKEILELLQLKRDSTILKKIKSLFTTASNYAIGNNKEVQYNDNGVLGSDPLFTRDPSTGAFNVSHNTNDTSITVGDDIFGGLLNGAAISKMNGTDITGIGVGDNLIVGRTGLDLIYLDTIGYESSSVYVNDTFESGIYYTDNALASDVEVEIVCKFDGASMAYKKDSLGIDNSATLGATGLVINGNYTLPLVDGTAGQVLSTDGNGVLSWITP